MKTLVFVGNSKKGGISIATVDKSKLVFSNPALPEEGIAPLAVHPNRKYLYAAVRSRTPNEIVTFAIDADGQALHPVSSIPVPVTVTYLTVDPSGLNLLAVSYADGEILVYALSPNGPAQPNPLERLHPERNPHGIHCALAGNHVFVPALGHDKILQYTFDPASGRLAPTSPPALPFPKNAGPRHLAFSPDRRHVYALTELSGTIATLGIDPATGALTHLGTTGILPPERALPPSSYTPPGNANAGGNSPTPVMWAADIGITPDGNFLYASERTNSTISCFARDQYSGRLDFVSIAETEHQPRSFAVDAWGRRLFVAGEKANTLAVLAIDQKTGALSPLDRHPVGDTPSWVATITC